MTDCAKMGMDKRPDRRTRKTRAAIRDAFFELLAQKSLDKITVTEITTRADLDRKTFYLHYESIEALTDELLREEAERMVETVDKAGVVEDGKINVLKLFYALSNKLMVDFGDKAQLLAHTDINQMIDRVEPVLVDVIVRNDSLNLAEDLGPYLDIFVTYFCAGLLSMYRRWIEIDSDLPMEQLSALAGATMAGGLGSLVTASRQYASR